MLVKTVRFFKGYVDFTAEGKFPERFINLTARNGVNIWNTVPVSGGLCGSMRIYDYRKIRLIARKSKVKTRIKAKHGLPFIANRYKERSGIAVGAMLGIILLIVLSNFVWSVSVTGNTRVSSESIRKALDGYGVSIGAYKNNLNVQSIERNMSLEISDIGWMSINLEGTIANVEIKEKDEKPQIDNNTTPCNIKAKTDGVVTKIKSKMGETKVLIGSGVTKGELLVSGILETKMNTIQYVHSNAEVYADVISKNEIKIPSEYNYYSLSENKSKRYRLKLLWLELPCSMTFDSYQSSAEDFDNGCLTSNEVMLPFNVKTQTIHEVKTCNVNIDSKTAEQITLDSAVLYEVFAKPDSTLVSRKIKTKLTGGEYVSIIGYVFNENIAESVDFSVTE